MLVVDSARGDRLERMTSALTRRYLAAYFLLLFFLGVIQPFLWYVVLGALGVMIFFTISLSITAALLVWKGIRVGRNLRREFLVCTPDLETTLLYGYLFSEKRRLSVYLRESAECFGGDATLFRQGKSHVIILEHDTATLLGRREKAAMVAHELGHVFMPFGSDISKCILLGLYGIWGVADDIILFISGILERSAIVCGIPRPRRIARFLRAITLDGLLREMFRRREHAADAIAAFIMGSEYPLLETLGKYCQPLGVETMNRARFPSSRLHPMTIDRIAVLQKDW
jgi:hypothetical protein